MRKYLEIVLPWGKYVYNKMSMGLKISADVFQRELSMLFQNMPYILVCIDDILVITKRSYEQHLQAVEKVLEKLQEAGMQLNIDKSHVATVAVEYLDYIISREGIKPQPTKVQLIVDMPRPKASTQVKRFSGMINFYSDLWEKRAHYLVPINTLTRNKKKGLIIWSSEAEKVFEDIKKIVAEDAMLHYPDFNQAFEIHTDSSDYQMGVIISQKGRPVAFWSKKLSDT